jgi:class 3 adenylate cyclase
LSLSPAGEGKGGKGVASPCFPLNGYRAYYAETRSCLRSAVTNERAERRLTAILAADVAGYSRLMGIDEEGTLARLKAHRRELVAPKIAEHRGRIVKTTGDGMLVEFASVVDNATSLAEGPHDVILDTGETPRGRSADARHARGESIDTRA